MNETLSNVARTVTDEPIGVIIDVKPQHRIHRLLQHWKILPKKRNFQIHQITYGNLMRISKLLITMDGDLVKLISERFDTLDQYGPLMLEAVCIGLHNKRSSPPDSLKKFVAGNVTAVEMASLFGAIVKQMHVEDFMHSIILIKRGNVLEMSRDLLGSSIAPGQQSDPS